MEMSKKILYRGPDISKHQGSVNIKAVRDAGYQRIGIRAGYGKNNVDEQYIRNAEACYKLGVPVLLYWFSYAYTEAMAAAEAGFAVAQAGKFWQKCPITFDFEYASMNYARKNGVDANRTLITDMAIAFLREVKKAGYIPVVYANQDYLRNHIDMGRITAELGEVYVWYARYTEKISAEELEAADVWQYTSKGRIPGIAGNVDMNRFYTAFPEDVLAGREDKANVNVKNFQRAANTDGYVDQENKRLAEDGIDGARTQYVRRQMSLKARRTILGYKAGSSGGVVSWLQTRLREQGYDVGVDGRYGKDTRAAIIRYQKEHNLVSDGIAGFDTIQTMFDN